MGPTYNRIHLGLGISPELPPQNDSVANSLFPGPIFDPNKVPGPKCRPEIKKSDPGLKIPPLGMKKQKMRAEKPCRIQSSEFRTEPYSASYGQKPFWRAPSKSSHGSPGGGEQVPPAVLFFENRPLFYTSPGGVVQVASGGSIF